MQTSVSMTIFLLVIGVLSVWLGILSVLFIKQQQFFKHFTEGVTKKDLKSSLRALSTTLKKASDDIQGISQQIETIIQNDAAHFQKQGFVRFNPYSDTGGNQSFCLCLLNDRNDGIVITSLHSREQTRIYAKTVKSGTSEDAQFSKEEKEALAMAVKA